MITCGKLCSCVCEDCLRYMCRYERCSFDKLSKKPTDTCNAFHCLLAPDDVASDSINGLNVELDIALVKLKHHTEYTCDRDRENYWRGYVDALRLIIRINERR